MRKIRETAKCVFQTRDLSTCEFHCTQEFIAALVTWTRPARAQASQYSSVDEEAQETLALAESLLTMMATGEGKSF